MMWFGLDISLPGQTVKWCGGVWIFLYLARQTAAMGLVWVFQYLAGFGLDIFVPD
jgi:hypothetical protein